MKIIKKRFSTLLSALSLCLIVHQSVSADTDWEKVKIKTIPVSEGIYMLMGEGGNIGVSIGEDGTFVIDDQYAPLSKKIIAAIKGVSGALPKFLANTHWHGDHAGGNAYFGEAGSILVAQDNVRKSLKVEKSIALFNMHKPPSPKAALPVITFNHQMSLHLNGNDIRLIHVPNAHTDGDAIVYFTEANVIHAGDTFFNGFYPFIDTESGGSIAGMIAACDVVLQLANDKTKIMPGHGPLASRADLVKFKEMLVTAETNIVALVAAGKSEEEVIAAKPTAQLDAEWADGFLPADVWVKIVYSGIKK